MSAPASLFLLAGLTLAGGLFLGCSPGTIGSRSGAAGDTGTTSTAGTTGAAATTGAAGTAGKGGTTGAAGATASGAGGSGGAGAGTGFAGAAGTGTGGAAGGGTATGALLDRLSTSDVTVTAGVKPGVRNWRIWADTMLKVAPVYTAPLASCGTLVCYTSGTAAAPNARLVKLDAADQAAGTLDLGAGLECRGLAAESDGHFAALLWDGTGKRIYVKRFDAAGAQSWSTELTNSDNSPTDFGIGESRLEFGGAKYGAYYHVHSNDGHEGDTYKFTDAATGTQTTQWGWGCSHSMSELLTYNAQAGAFLASCVTDCYPGTTSSDFTTGSIGGVYTENKNRILNVDAGCNGSVAGELGGAAVATSGWKLVFNAHQAPATMGQSSYSTATMNQDIGFASVATNRTLSGAVVWLTTTTGLNEADSAIARWQPEGDPAEQYVIGWMEPSSPAAYKLGRVDPSGTFIEIAADISAKARWGQRDDPFRVHANHDVVWAWFDAAGSTVLHLGRLRSGGTAQCATF
jgi:hypothetical protein